MVFSYGFYAGLFAFLESWFDIYIYIYIHNLYLYFLTIKNPKMNWNNKNLLFSSEHCRAIEPDHLVIWFLKYFLMNFW